MASIIEIVLPTFFVIIVGYLVGRFSRINMAPVVDLNIYVAIPALVFVSLVSKHVVLADAARIWAAAIIIVYGCMLVAWLVFKPMKQKHSGLYVAVSQMNTVNIPFPIIYLAYGAEGLASATLFFIPCNISFYSLGIFIMAGKHWRENIREVVTQPAVYASLSGLALTLLNIRLPVLLFNSLDFLSKMAIPLVLVILGYNLSRVKISSLKITLLASFLRVGVGLGLGLLAVWGLGITGVARSVVILDAAMPAAAMSSVIATKYDNEAGLVSSVVFVTTVASLVVIPFLLKMLG